MAAAEARAAGYGGIAAVARATGIARSTIGRGLADLDQPALPPGQVRRGGSGRKPVQEKDPTLLADLRRLVEPATHGDPMRPLLWVSKSHAKLADALCAMGHPISPNTVGKLLREELGYSRRTNRKTLEGASHPDRDSQFAPIKARACTFREAGQPVIEPGLLPRPSTAACPRVNKPDPQRCERAAATLSANRQSPPRHLRQCKVDAVQLPPSFRAPSYCFPAPDALSFCSPFNPRSV